MKHFSLRGCLDFWSLPHFLFGSVVSLFSLAFHVDIFFAFLGTFFIALFWELFEWKIGIRETLLNGVLDVLLPLFSFWMTLLLVQAPFFDDRHTRSLLAVSIIIYFFTNFIAWQARFNREKEFLQ